MTGGIDVIGGAAAVITVASKALAVSYRHTPAEGREFRANVQRFLNAENGRRADGTIVTHLERRA